MQMKQHYTLLIFLCVTFGYGQEVFDKVNKEYNQFLYRIAEKDTIIKNRTKYYRCSEDLSGRIEYYYQDKKLRFIKHIYQQGFRNESSLENYFIKEDTLRIKTSITEEIFINTLYKKSDQGVSSTSAEKVVEVTEQRMLFSKDHSVSCFERKHGQKLGDWDQEYFEALSFKKEDCLDDLEDIRYKYRLLRKAEKKLESYSNRKPRCIFYMW